MIVQRNSSIRRSQIWLVTLDPTVGAEIQKRRPCVVVSHDLIGALPIRVVVPITEWQERFAGNRTDSDAMLQLLGFLHTTDRKPA